MADLVGMSQKMTSKSASTFMDPYALSEQTVRSVLAEYGLQLHGTPVPAGGTAAPKVTFGAHGESGRFLLRKRRAEFCPEPVVRFDHSVIRQLALSGLPVVEPLKTRQGKTYVRVNEATFEISPFIEGLRIMDQDDLEQIADAGRQLGRLHRATEGFIPDGHKYWRREFHMGANRATLAAFLRTPAANGPLRPFAERMLAFSNRIVEALPDVEVERLPHCIIHGDYTWSNIMYRDRTVGGIFDFDWTDRQPRIHDLARALIWFAGRRKKPLDPDSMWSLAQDWVADDRSTEALLDAYGESVRLTAAEKRLLPAMVAETWFCCRIRAMRKVPDDQKLAILADDLQASWTSLEEKGWPWGYTDQRSR